MTKQKEIQEQNQKQKEIKYLFANEKTIVTDGINVPMGEYDDETGVSMPSNFNSFMKKAKYSDDSESTPQNFNELETFLYAIGSYDMMSNQFKHWVTQDSYMVDFLSRPNNSITYYHNLGWDGEFILWYCIKKKFKQVFEIKTYDKETGRNIDLADIINEPSYEIRVDKLKNWYAMTFYIPTDEINKKGKRKIKVLTILDSAKILTMSVSEMAKSFDLKDENGEPYRKGDIDHDVIRVPGEELTEDVLSYLERDCAIVGKSLNIMFQQGSIQQTMSGNSLDAYKRTMWNDAHCYKVIEKMEKEHIKSGKESKFKKPSLKQVRESEFRKVFPVLKNEEIDFVFESYRGGVTQNNKMLTYQTNEKTGKLLKDENGSYIPRIVPTGIVFDINSSYPDKLRNKMLPYGRGVKFEGEYVKDEKYPLYIIAVKFKFRLKEKKTPFIQVKHNMFFKDSQILENSKGRYVTMVMTNVYWELVKDCYYTYPESTTFMGGYKYKASNENFVKFIDECIYNKNKFKKSDPARSLMWKTNANSLYGKFGSRVESWLQEVHLNNKGKMEMETKQGEDRDPIYPPVACFTTDYGRKQLIETCNLNFNDNGELRWLYMDTDSLHFEGTEDVILPKGQYVHPQDLGQWDCEGVWVSGKFLRAKTYLEYKFTETIPPVERVEEGYKGKVTYDGRWKGLVRPSTFRKNVDEWYDYEKKTGEFEIDKTGEYKLDSDGNKIEIVIKSSLKRIPKCAGMNDDIKERVRLHNFTLGQKFEPWWLSPCGTYSTKEWFKGCTLIRKAKKVPKAVNGGKFLVQRAFTIKFEHGTRLEEMSKEASKVMRLLVKRGEDIERNKRYQGMLKKLKETESKARLREKKKEDDVLAMLFAKMM